MGRSANRQCFHDKQLLWRANLYMAEASKDWNDCNPWVDASAGSDNWNPPEVSSGGQDIAVLDATWPGDDSFHVQDSVAYSINCHDSPAEYNRKMLEQSSILDHLRDSAGGWDLTTAPDGLWANYAGPGAIAQLPAGETDRPYRPGYSSEWYARSRATWQTNIVTAMQQSAGVDCVGLVQRSASYPGNVYGLPEVRDYAWATADPSAGRVNIDGRFLTTVTARDPGGDEPGNLDRVIPGDVLYYPGHAMMVEEVKSTAGRSVGMKDIRMIEATSCDYQGDIGVTDCVVTARTLWDVNLQGYPWVLGRLIRQGGGVKRWLTLLAFTLPGSLLWATDFDRYDVELVRTYPLGESPAGFELTLYRDYPRGPTAIALDKQGRLYVCDAVRERIAVADKSLEIREDHAGNFSGGARRFEVDDRGIANHHYLDEFSFVDWAYEDRFIVSFEKGRYNDAIVSDSSLYFGNVVLTYLMDGSLISVVNPTVDWKENEGKILGQAETRALFKEPAKYGLTGLTLDDGGRLYVKGEIETRSYRVFLGWCEETNGGKLLKVGNAVDLARDPHRSSATATYHGKDMAGNVYWHAGDTVLVFNRAGAVIEMLMTAGGIGLGAVHPSGDLYGISYDEKGVYLHRIRNVWDPKARELWEAYVISTTGEGIRAAAVTAGPLRVRRAAGSMGEIAGELQKGERVEVLWHGSEKAQIGEMNDYWYEVRRKSDGLQGWVYGGYLRIQ